MMTEVTRTVIRFTMDDLDEFARASHDWSPLHADAAYAYRTPYGARIVYGVLEQLICLSALPDREGYTLSSVTAEFIHPMFVELDYVIETLSASMQESQFRIYDGERIAVKGRAFFRPGAPIEPNRLDALPNVRQVPVELSAADLHKGRRVNGEYWPVQKSLEAWMERLKLRAKGVGAAQTAALMWQTYLAGMVLPGRHSLCSKLTTHFQEQAVVSDAAIDYDAEVIGYDDRFSKMRARASLQSHGVMVAESELHVFLREPVAEVTVDRLEELLPRSRALMGKVAIVTGASRGFGAAVSLGLALQGATVLTMYHRSEESMMRLAELVPDGCGSIRPYQGDVSDAAWCLKVQKQWDDEYGHPDIVVINAGLPLLSMAMEVQQLERVQQYVSSSFRLASVPLSVWLKPVAAKQGWCVVLSAESVVDAPPDYPHYVAAKSAIEGLAKSAAKQHKGKLLIVRPPRMRTDLSNTPLARHDSILPEHVAVEVIKRIVNTSINDGYEILEDSFRHQ
ncbi:SDR family NAD(P)-dependent oxidoreductase [Paenibacillus sp. MER TA 81-3]|uniref:SDR family NAD(P)-dependent oxidoreductase n=1 Tax=Paenibacillus sp. MER TA 81-3 TaxID=2939573 RepID=UPI0020423452|nr:SDR family NAD(P)-dependent oxidoreductase [Paenibacillus sp. MER TA 81-3]MCM3338075.1 SDR family NAD(P)-dependent oxidoreductase [Paenibacillus sp. MER TA 81-3]